jgi:hypothetical protein
MRSSTFSSSAARPAAGKWRGTWLAALVCVTLIVAAWEAVLRIRGLEVTSVEDSAELWAQERDRAAELGDDAVILVGTSQMQMSMDLPTMKRYTTGFPVQLAISASPFMPVLADLADDPRITGTVICSFTMGDFVRVTTDTRADQWVRRYRHVRESRTQVFYQRVENRLARAVGTLLASIGTGARPQHLVLTNPANYVRTLPDRSQRADYAIIDREAAYEHRVAVYLSGAEPELMPVPDLDARFAELEGLVRKIEDRGGDVVFVTFPTTRRIREMDETMYPKRMYWDELVRRTDAKTIHFAEHASLSRFELPDGVHLDYRDAPAFTEALSALVFSRDIAAAR